jgi:hypothetical protein
MRRDNDKKGSEYYFYQWGKIFDLEQSPEF